MRNREVLVRQFRMVVLLHQKARGLSVEEIAEALGMSRPLTQEPRPLSTRDGSGLSCWRSG